MRYRHRLTQLNESPDVCKKKKQKDALNIVYEYSRFSASACTCLNTYAFGLLLNFCRFRLSESGSSTDGVNVNKFFLSF